MVKLMVIVSEHILALSRSIILLFFIVYMILLYFSQDYGKDSPAHDVLMQYSKSKGSA